MRPGAEAANDGRGDLDGRQDQDGRQEQRDGVLPARGSAPGSTAEAWRIAKLERELEELRSANRILRSVANRLVAQESGDLVPEPPEDADEVAGDAADGWSPDDMADPL